ncbi:MAG: hypothetical protein GY847_23145 [Proteobacteria bacterium]|nr:hypothetical protein [Pseudomonadota bacterium]
MAGINDQSPIKRSSADTAPLKQDKNIRIIPVARVSNKNAKTESDANKKRKHPDNRDETKYHFQNLANAAERAHKTLVADGSPYRFCVYREGDDILIDVVILDEDGKISSIKKQNITHDEFIHWIESIEQGHGLFVDRSM